MIILGFVNFTVPWLAKAVIVFHTFIRPLL